MLEMEEENQQRLAPKKLKEEQFQEVGNGYQYNRFKRDQEDFKKDQQRLLDLASKVTDDSGKMQDERGSCVAVV